MKVTLIQTRPQILSTRQNLAQMESAMRKADGDIMLFPELATSGYNFRSQKEVLSTSENAVSGPTCKLLSHWSKRKNAAIVAGFPEKAGTKIYNAALIVTPSSVRVYRKIHLFWREKRFFTAGKASPPVLSWKNARFGVMICFDWFFPEVSRKLARRGADIILHPSNLVLPYAPEGMKTRSLENHVFSATCNRVGNERGLSFIGKSQVLDHKGRRLGGLSGNRTGLLSVNFDYRKARNKNLTPTNHIFRDI